MFDNEKENFLSWLSTKLEQSYRRKTLAKFFIIGFVGNILSWIIALFAPGFIGKFVSTLMVLEGKIGIYLLVIPFSFAFLMAFSVCKLRTAQIQNITSEKKEVFDNLFENLRKDDYRIIFLISAMFGSLNCLLLVFILTTFGS